MAHPHYSSIEIKVGIFLAFSLALFVGMVVNFGKFWTAWGRERIEIFVAFDNVSGLKPDAPVRYNGLEVGRVKWMRVLHLDDEAIERMPQMAKRDIDNLPIRPESVERKLREASEADFPSMLKQELKTRTMIELCLEVLQDGDVKRYRIDDQVRVVSTVFGDTAVEIISGNGAINTQAGNRMMIGTSGDFFSNLARSMGDVKDILSNVTDVVGADERKSFERAQSRFAPMSEKLDAMAATANKRSAETSRKLDKIGDGVNANLSRIQDIMQTMQPKAKETGDRVREGFSKMQERVDEVQTAASKAFTELNADKEAIKNDFNSAIEQSKPNFEAMKTNIRGVYDVLGGLSQKLDGMRDKAGRLFAQSQPDLVRGSKSLQNSLVFLQQTGQAANENKDLMISMKDIGESEFATATLIFRDMNLAVRRMRDAGAAVQESLESCDDAEKVNNAKKTLKNMDAMRLPLEKVRDGIEDKMLPQYERKKAAWND